MKQTRKQLEFILKAVGINLVLYLAMLPFNIMQFMIAFLVKMILFLVGIHASISYAGQGIFIRSSISQVGMFQAFYEILTLMALTLALKRRKFLLTIVPVIAYYVLLYSASMFLFEKGIDATFITDFLAYQSDYLVLLLLVFWAVVNKRSVLEIFK